MRVATSQGRLQRAASHQLMQHAHRHLWRLRPHVGLQPKGTHTVKKKAKKLRRGHDCDNCSCDINLQFKTETALQGEAGRVYTVISISIYKCNAWQSTLQVASGWWRWWEGGGGFNHLLDLYSAHHRSDFFLSFFFLKGFKGYFMKEVQSYLVTWRIQQFKFPVKEKFPLPYKRKHQKSWIK